MFIILEGCDGSGKSTLAKKLAKQTGYEVLHRDKPKTEKEKEEMRCMYYTMVLNACHENKGYILDRSWYSEMVYGKIFRDKSYVDLDTMYNLEAYLAESGAMVIYCTDSVLSLWRRCKARGEDYVTSIFKLWRISRGYNKLMKRTAHLIPVVQYKVGDGDEDMSKM